VRSLNLGTASEERTGVPLCTALDAGRESMWVMAGMSEAGLLAVDAPTLCSSEVIGAGGSRARRNGAAGTGRSRVDLEVGVAILGQHRRREAGSSPGYLNLEVEVL